MAAKIKYCTKEEAIVAVTKNGSALNRCSPELKKDEEVVIASIKNDIWSFYYAYEDFKSSKPFIMKALNEGVKPWGLISYANIVLQSDIEVITLVLEKSHNGQEFSYAQGEAALNKELTAKALVKSGNHFGHDYCGLWVNLHPTMKEFFPKDSWYKKAQSYLIQLEQEKQAKSISGGSTAEDGVVW